MALYISSFPYLLSLSPPNKFLSPKRNTQCHFFSSPLLSGAASAAPVAVAAFVEPYNALSLPTWAIHVSSVVEWVAAMILAWKYGDKSGFCSWKGLSWAMVLPLGSALCACTWHFFYDSESLEVLVALQAGLTVLGNMTMCIAALRIYEASKEGSETP